VKGKRRKQKNQRQLQPIKHSSCASSTFVGDLIFFITINLTNYVLESTPRFPSFTTKLFSSIIQELFIRHLPYARVFFFFSLSDICSLTYLSISPCLYENQVSKLDRYSAAEILNLAELRRGNYFPQPSFSGAIYALKPVSK
jgi:hypothetical protein